MTYFPRVLWQTLEVLTQHPIWIELFRIFAECRLIFANLCKEKDEFCVGWYEILAAKYDWTCRSYWAHTEDWSCWLQTEGFSEHANYGVSKFLQEAYFLGRRSSTYASRYGSFDMCS